MTTAKSVGSTTSKPETTFEEMLNAIGESLNDLASSEDKQTGWAEEDEEEDKELGKLTADDKPGWVMGTISKTVQHRMESYRQKHIRLDDLTQPELQDAVNHFWERDKKYETAELKVPAVVKPQIDTTAATPSLTTFRDYMQTLDIVRGQSPMPAVTFQQGSSQMWLGSEKLRWEIFVFG